MAILIIFLSIVAVLLYLLFAYPLLLLTRRRHLIQKEFAPRTVTILLAVRNGGSWLDQKLTNLSELDYPRELVDIIVISDGSTDSTEQIARSWQNRGVRLIARANEGKSAALNAGISEARGEILLFTDVRQRLAPESLREMVACFHDPSVGVVSGELIIAEGESTEEASVGLYWKYEKWIRLRLSNIDSIPGASGCIYAIRRQLTVTIPNGILLDDVYLPLAAFFRGYRLILEPAAKAFDSAASLDAEFHRKVRTQAGVYQLLRHYPQLLGLRNRMWLDFISHKFGRLFLPWLLIALFFVSLALPWPWRAAFVAQAIFYAVAALDEIMPDGWPGKWLTSMARTFVTLMAATACAVAIAVVPADRFWKPAAHPKPAADGSQSSTISGTGSS